MSFPQTRMTLIQRLASGGTEEDWQGFLKDYWGPVCRFSLRWGAKNLDDAEDVASETFRVLWEHRLLVRWMSNRSAKLRTLLCSVIRNILSHRNRVRASREQRQADLVDYFEQLNPTPDEHVDAFYASWVEDIVQQAVESMAGDYCRNGQVDYVRVLYGRLCQGMTITKAAEALELSPATVDHYFRHAKRLLSEKLEQLTRRQVQSYCPAEEAEQEFATEWQRLGQYLAEHGGLDEVVQRAYDLLSPVQARKQREVGLPKAAARLTSIIHSSSCVTRSGDTTYRQYWTTIEKWSHCIGDFRPKPVFSVNTRLRSETDDPRIRLSRLNPNQVGIRVLLPQYIAICTRLSEFRRPEGTIYADADDGSPECVGTLHQYHKLLWVVRILLCGLKRLLNLVFRQFDRAA